MTMIRNWIKTATLAALIVGVAVGCVDLQLLSHGKQTDLILGPGPLVTWLRERSKETWFIDRCRDDGMCWVYRCRADLWTGEKRCRDVLERRTWAKEQIRARDMKVETDSEAYALACPDCVGDDGQVCIDPIDWDR